MIYLSITLVGLKLLRGLEAKTRLPGHAPA